jgi:hypothetical protein
MCPRLREGNDVLEADANGIRQTSIAIIKVHPAIFMKTKEGEKEGIRCQVLGVRLIVIPAQRGIQNGPPPSRG